MKSVAFGLLLTFFSVFDVPVFWPILLLYWCVLFFVTMKRQIRHMIKHRYLPFTYGKKVRVEPCWVRAAAAGACPSTSCYSLLATHACLAVVQKYRGRQDKVDAKK